MKRFALVLGVTTGLSLAMLLLMWPTVSSAQNVVTINCQNGDVLSGSYADVIVNGTSCTLDGATVNGSVLVSNGGTLTTTANGATIFGSVQVNSGGDITLEAANVSGAVTLEQQSGNLTVKAGSTLTSIVMKDSGNVTIEAGASTGEVLVDNSGDVAVSGTVAAVSSTGSGDISLIDATVFPGGVTMSLSGELVICGSAIGVNAGGGVNVIESGGVLAVADVTCDASQIEGSVVVAKGMGDVRFVDATLNSDLNVIEQAGAVEVIGMGMGVAVSDVKVEKTTGDVTLQNVITDSDTTIKDNGGNVTIDASTLGSDVEISLNGGVTITDNNFSLEDVLISNNSGPVVVDGNVDLSMSIIENNAVTVSGNTFTDADISKNTGGVSIVNNTGEVLKCSDNNPAPTGSGNTITELADGQCTGF